MDFTALSDEQLAVRARLEPRASFGELFERYRGPLWNFIVRQGFDGARAEDLFQTTFLKALRAVAGFREESRFKTWIYTIAVNVMNDERRIAVRRGRNAELHEETAEAPAAGHDPVEHAEAMERVKHALGSFPIHHRHLFALVRFQGLSIAEAAEAVGMEPPAAKVTLFRVHKRIGEMLAPVREKL